MSFSLLCESSVTQSFKGQVFSGTRQMQARNKPKKVILVKKFAACGLTNVTCSNLGQNRHFREVEICLSSPGNGCRIGSCCSFVNSFYNSKLTKQRRLRRIELTVELDNSSHVWLWGSQCFWMQPSFSLTRAFSTTLRTVELPRKQIWGAKLL